MFSNSPHILPLVAVSEERDANATFSNFCMVSSIAGKSNLATIYPGIPILPTWQSPGGVDPKKTNPGLHESQEGATTLPTGS